MHAEALRQSEAPDPGGDRSPPEVTAASSLRARSGWASLFVVCLAIGLVQFLPTLGSSYAYDDIDYLNQAADVMAGRDSMWRMLWRPQGEHLVPAMRLALYGSAAVFGAWAFPYRLLVLLTHVASGVLLAVTARRTGRSRPAAWAAAIAYVLPCGFSSMWVWFPSGATVPFGMMGITGALACVVSRHQLGVRRARVLAVLGVAWALLCESTLAPMVLVPALADEVERRREGRRGPVGAVTVASLALAAAIALAASLAYTATFGPRISVDIWHGIPRAAYLFLVAPFRLFFPGIPVHASEPGASTAVLGALVGSVVGCAALALLLARWRTGLPPLARLVLLVSPGPLATLGLVGIGRWRVTYWELFDADRYFFTLLVPISLLAAAVAAEAAPRLATWSRAQRVLLGVVLLAGLAAEMVLHRRAVTARVPFDVYEAHERRFAQLADLAAGLDAAAREAGGARPALLPDTDLYFPEIHNGRLSTRFLVHVVGPGESAWLRLGGQRTDARSEEIFNPVLSAWAGDIGERLPYLEIREGRLVDAHLVAAADFRTAAHDDVAVQGFYPWEGTSRWMGATGDLRLTMVSPRLDLLLAVPPEVGPLGITVAIRDEATGTTMEIGAIEAGAGTGHYRLDGTPFAARFGNGRAVHVLLRAERTWRPLDLLPGNADARELSVLCFAVGFEPLA